MSMIDEFKNEVNNLKDKTMAKKNQFEKEAYELKERQATTDEEKNQARLGRAEASAKEAWNKIKAKF